MFHKNVFSSIYKRMLSFSYSLCKQIHLSARIWFVLDMFEIALLPLYLNKALSSSKGQHPLHFCLLDVHVCAKVKNWQKFTHFDYGAHCFVICTWVPNPKCRLQILFPQVSIDSRCPISSQSLVPSYNTINIKSTFFHYIFHYIAKLVFQARFSILFSAH